MIGITLLKKGKGKSQKGLYWVKTKKMGGIISDVSIKKEVRKNININTSIINKNKLNKSIVRNKKS